jgi:transcriptional regulator with XRE-family HTH domain
MVHKRKKYERKKPIPENQQAILASIGGKIFELRKGTNLSIERFCVKNDIPRISYSNLEAGKNFQMTTLLKIIESHPDVKSLRDFFSDI